MIKYVDTHQVAIALPSSYVLGSRLTIWMFREADINLYLYADDETRVKRIFMREGGIKDGIRAFTAIRGKQDTARYEALYGIDNDDYNSVADIVIDTKKTDAERVAQQVINALLSQGRIKASQ